MGNFPVIDLIFLVLVVLMLIHGYVKGFVVALFSWATLVLSMLAAVFLYSQGAAFIRSKIMENVKYIPEILSFLVIFLVVMLFLKMLERVLKDIIQGSRLGGVDKILGAVLGLVHGFALTTVILFILTVQPIFDSSVVIGDSIFAQILLPVIQAPLNRGKEIIDAVYFFLPEAKRFLV